MHRQQHCISKAAVLQLHAQTAALHIKSCSAAIACTDSSTAYQKVQCCNCMHRQQQCISKGAVLQLHAQTAALHIKSCIAVTACTDSSTTHQSCRVVTACTDSNTAYQKLQRYNCMHRQQHCISKAAVL